MKLTSSKTIRGTEVEVTATDFDGDTSVGMPYGPEVVYAETLDGEPFELTDEETEELIIEFSKSYNEISFDEDYF